MAVVRQNGGPVFRGPRVTLRPTTEEDLPRLLAWENDPEISRWAGKRFECDEEAREWYICGNNLQRRTFAIELANGEVIGETEVINISWRLHTAEIRIFIGDRSVRDRGFGEESVKALASGLFETTCLAELFLQVDETNHRAKRCYEKVGFRAVGRVCVRDGDKLSTILLMTLSRRGMRKRRTGCRV